MQTQLLIASANDPVAADYAIHVRRSGMQAPLLVAGPAVQRRLAKEFPSFTAQEFTQNSSAISGSDVSAAVIFLGRRWGDIEEFALDAIAVATAAGRRPRVCVVSTFRVHFGDHRAERLETDAVARLKAAGGAVTVLRHGHLLSENSPTARVVRKLGFLAPLVHRGLTSCFLDGDELFDALDRETAAPPSRFIHEHTLLGCNRPWRDVLGEQRRSGLVWAALAAVAMIMNLFGVGWALARLFKAAKHISPRMPSWDFDTLWPTTPRALLALCSPHNFRHIKIVGYNNGVVHFGQSFPGRTVVSTIRCNRVARVGDGLAKFDGGVTIRQATTLLAGTGHELCVVPNYSYVSLGTAFFVPIHGSASAASTLGETIEKVLLYDPAEDRFIVTRKGEPEFDRHIFGLNRDVLLVRLYLRVQKKNVYFLQRQTVPDASGPDLLGALADDRPSNVEVRKAKAAGRTVDVYRYYAQNAADQRDTMEFPRDAVGRLWDCIEENPVTAALFHGLMRRFGYHVELFLGPDDFLTFWSTHKPLPISKIQLRYVRRDGRPHSPFRDHDCVSADLFMLRKHKQVFNRYVKETLHMAQFNPGKHSA